MVEGHISRKPEIVFHFFSFLSPGLEQSKAKPVVSLVDGEFRISDQVSIPPFPVLARRG